MALSINEIARDIKNKFPELEFSADTPWTVLSTIGIGKQPPLLAEPANDIELAQLLSYCTSSGIPLGVLGGGSNIIGSDEPFDALLIHLAGRGFSQISFGREHVTAGAGLSLHSFLVGMAEAGFGGYSGMAGIPGTVGGALRMNAGANASCISDYIEELCGFYFDGTPWISDKQGVTWAYRSSSIPENVIVTAAIFKPRKVTPSAEIALIRKQLDLRRSLNPKGRSAGCVFKNPSPEDPAGRLIERAGLKGMRFGGISISGVHANYFINDGDASESDFLELAVRAKREVFKSSGLYLQPEVKFINKNSEKKLMSSEAGVNVLVLKGGCSSEREISLISGGAVADALRQAGYSVTEYDIKKVEVTDDMKAADIVFPVLHGGFGEGGQIQDAMEKAGVCFVGCSSMACNVIMNKIESKRLMDKNSIGTAGYVVVTASDRKFPDHLGLPLVVKAPCEGSTVGITLLSKKEDWDKVIDETLKFGPEVLVEKFIDGAEVTVGVLDGKALPVIEIRYPGKMYDYDAKYTHKQGETLYLCPPKSIDDAMQKKLQKTAEDFFNAVGARDMLRVDMMISEKDSFINVLEGNSIPGFTPSSLLPKAAKVAGMSFPSLVSVLVKAALARKKK